MNINKNEKGSNPFFPCPLSPLHSFLPFLNFFLSSLSLIFPTVKLRNNLQRGIPDARIYYSLFPSTLRHLFRGMGGRRGGGRSVINVGKRLIARGPASCPPTSTHLHTETVAFGEKSRDKMRKKVGYRVMEKKREGRGDKRKSWVATESEELSVLLILNCEPCLHKVRNDGRDKGWCEGMIKNNNR